MKDNPTKIWMVYTGKSHTIEQGTQHGWFMKDNPTKIWTVYTGKSHTIEQGTIHGQCVRENPPKIWMVYRENPIQLNGVPSMDAL